MRLLLTRQWRRSVRATVGPHSTMWLLPITRVPWRSARIHTCLVSHFAPKLLDPVAQPDSSGSADLTQGDFANRNRGLKANLNDVMCRVLLAASEYTGNPEQ